MKYGRDVMRFEGSQIRKFKFKGTEVWLLGAYIHDIRSDVISQLSTYSALTVASKSITMNMATTRILM
jgi:hypothetical protein